MFKLMVYAHTERGNFLGEFAESDSKEKLKETMDLIEDKINIIKSLTLEMEDGSRSTFNETILKNSVLSFKIEEV